MLGFGVIESGTPATLIECGVVRTSASQPSSRTFSEPRE